MFDVENDEGGLEAWAENLMQSGLLFPEHLKDCERVKNQQKCVQPLQLQCRVPPLLLAQNSTVLEDERVQGQRHRGTFS